LWSPGSGVAWNKPLSETGRSTRNPVLLARDAEIFAAWIEEDESGRVDVWGGWWDLDGMPSVAAFPIGPASAGTWNLNAAFDGAGRPVVVFDATVETDAEEIFIARLDRQNVDLRRVTADDGARSKYPDIGFSGAEAALTWFDERDGNREIYLFVGPVARLAEGFESEALRVTRTPGHSIGAYLHWSEDQLGLAWSDDSDGAYDIYFQTFDRTGRPIVQARRLTSTAADSLIPAIRSWNGSFALAWNEVSYMPPEPEGHSPDARSEIMFSLVR
jgi:hypothetical protein